VAAYIYVNGSPKKYGGTEPKTSIRYPYQTHTFPRGLIVQEKSIKVPSCLPQKASPQTPSSESKSKRKSRPKRKVPFLPFSLLSLLPALGPTLIYTYAGGGKGKWSAYKSGEMARRYEDRGGDYEDTGDNKNKAQKGAPKKK